MLFLKYFFPAFEAELVVSAFSPHTVLVHNHSVLVHNQKKQLYKVKAVGQNLFFYS